MNNCMYRIRSLPDVEIYGGDTTSFEVSLMRDNGSPFMLSSVDGYTCSLSLMPFSVTSGLGNFALTAKPTLCIEGILRTDSNSGGVLLSFNLASVDTKNLRGKYIYQIEIAHNSDMMVSQGHLLIKPNINR